MLNYLNNSVWCTLAPSSISGIGVFAIRDIPKGTKITDHTNETLDDIETYELTTEEFQQIHPAIQSLILDRTLFEDIIRFTSPNTDAVLRSFMNHSDTPNSDGVIALRDIKQGEEVTENFKSMVHSPHELTKKHMHFLWK